MRSRLSIFFTIAISVTSFAAKPVFGQDTLVTRGSIETADGIRFSAWLNDATIKQNQETRIYFSVENRSPQTIYLAWSQDGPYIDMDCRLNLHLYPSHMDGNEGHSTTDFKFIKVGKRKVYRGVLTIPMKAYSNSDTYSVAISLGYLTDISGLIRRAGEDPARFNGLFNARAKYFGFGGLSVDVEK